MNSDSPKISMIVSLGSMSERYLHDMIKSIREQTYANWELCLVGSGGLKVSIIVGEYVVKDSRIKFTPLDSDQGITNILNAVLKQATGDYVAFLDHDARLPPFSVLEIAKVINDQPDVDFIYSDEGRVDVDSGQLIGYYFKPGFCPDTLLSYNYIGHLSVVKKSLLDQLDGFWGGFDSSSDYALVLRITEKAKKIIHIPMVLYYGREHRNALDYSNDGQIIAIETDKQALKDHLNRLGISGEVASGLIPMTYKISYTIVGYPIVSIIIPTINHLRIVKKCVDSILTKTTYKNIELLLVDTGSTEANVFRYYEELINKYSFIQLLYDKRPFNYSAVNNLAVTKSKGGILLFLNNDVEIINGDWIERMLEHAQRETVGAVGAKLYYFDGRIQHGGIIVGICGVAGHAHKNFPRQATGYMGRLKIIQNISAVTGACMMMRRNVFDAVGGFDDRYMLAFNDVDLCLRIIEKNYRVVWTPYAELYHYESKTRGYEDTPEKQERFAREIVLFKSRWKAFLEQGDPCYNPNLTQEREDFSIVCA